MNCFREIKTIDELIEKLNLVYGMSVSFGSDSYYETCHFNIKSDIHDFPEKEGNIDSIRMYYEEVPDSDTFFGYRRERRVSVTMTLNRSFCGLPRATYIVDEEWFNKYVSDITVYTE